VATPKPNDHVTINGPNIATLHIPTDRHDLRGQITVREPLRHIGATVFEKTFSLHLRHRSRLGGLVYCMSHRTIGNAQSSSPSNKTGRAYIWNRTIDRSAHRNHANLLTVDRSVT